jgi:8-oxo-dGTP diphosphatase
LTHPADDGCWAAGERTAKDQGAARPVVLVAAAALVDVDGRVLLARRPEGKAMAGLWEFPGGKVQPGETPEAAVIRELQEELAIDTRSSCLAPLAFASHAYDDFHLLMPLFVWHAQPSGRPGSNLGPPPAPGRLPHAPGGRTPGGPAARLPLSKNYRDLVYAAGEGVKPWEKRAPWMMVPQARTSPV